MIPFIPPKNRGQEPRRLSSEGGPSVGGPVIWKMEHCSTANEAPGELEELLRNHTLFLYYAKYCAETRMALALRLMNGSSPRLRLPPLHPTTELERTGHLSFPIHGRKSPAPTSQDA